MRVSGPPLVNTIREAFTRVEFLPKAHHCNLTTTTTSDKSSNKRQNYPSNILQNSQGHEKQGGTEDLAQAKETG